MPSERQAFVFPADAAMGMAVEARVANALEFIAHYLDRIDGHLEKLAAQVESGNSNGKLIAQHLGGISHLVGNIATRL